LDAYFVGRRLRNFGHVALRRAAAAGLGLAQLPPVVQTDLVASDGCQPARKTVLRDVSVEFRQVHHYRGKYLLDDIAGILGMKIRAAAPAINHGSVKAHQALPCLRAASAKLIQ